MKQQWILQHGVGLALGSGSARGLAHIGVIRALEEAGIHVDCVAGTSIGAVIGAVYASGKLDSLQDAYLAMDWKKIAYFFDIVFPKSGIIDGRKLADFVREYVDTERFEELSMAFSAVATDLNTGEEVVLATGDVIEAVRASFSVPGMFTPVRMGERILIDGGIVNPVPVSVVRKMGAKTVIAVDLNHDVVVAKAPPVQTKMRTDNEVFQKVSRLGGVRYRTAMARIEQGLRSLDKNPAWSQLREWLAEEPLPNIFDVLLGSLNIMATQITRSRLQIEPPDLLIQPSLGNIRFLEYNRAEEIIAIGYEATRKQLEQVSVERYAG